MKNDILLKFQQIVKDNQNQQDFYNENRTLQFDSFFLTKFDIENNEQLSKLNIENFNIYIIDSITNNKIYYSNKDFSLFSLENKILICFHRYKIFTPKGYLYVEYNNKIQLIQTNFFENIQKFFYMGKDHSWGSFIFFGCNIIEKQDSFRDRCDFNDYGPVLWNAQGEAKQRGYDESFGEKIDLGQLAEISILMTVPNCGYISYLRLKPVNGKVLSDNYNNDLEVPVVARTVFELLKLIDEWSSVTEEPWNNKQEISIKSKEFMSAINSNEVDNSIKSNQTNMQVYRYLQGLQNARERPPLEEINYIPQDVYEWIIQQYCYQDFQNLLLYHPFLNKDI